MTTKPAYAANICWTGGAGDGKWSTGANWNGGSAPGSTGVAVFDNTTCTGTPNASVSIDSSISISGITISHYTGTITQGAASTVTLSANYSQTATGSTFTGSSAAISITGTFTLSNGAFTSTSGTLSIGTNLSITGGTFTHNSGNITFNTGNNTALACNNVSFSTVTISKTTGATLTVGSDCSLPVGNSPTLGTPGGITNNGTITAGTGTVTFGGYIGNSTGVLTMSGTAISTSGSIVLNSGTTFPSGVTTLTVGTNLTINSGVTFPSNVALTLNSNASSVLACNNVTFSLVTISKGAGGVTVGSDCTLPVGNSATLSSPTPIINNGTISAGTGTLTITSGGYTGNSTGVLSMSGTNLVVGALILSAGTTFPSGITTLTVGADLTINSGVTFPSNLALTINSNSNGSLSCNNVTFSSVAISKGAGSLTVGSDCTLPLGNSATVAAPNGVTNNGTITAGTGVLTFSNAAYTGGATGVLTSSGTGITLGVDLTLNSGTTFPNLPLTFNGNTSPTLSCGGVTLNSVTISKLGTFNTFTLQSDCTVGNFTFTQGTIANPGSAHKLTVTGNYSESATTTLGGANLTIEFGGSGSQTISKSAGTFSSLFSVNKTGGSASLSTTFATSSQTCTVVAGVFDINGQSFTCGSTFTIQNGGTLQMIGTETPTSPTLNAGSTVSLKGNGDSGVNSYTIPNYSYSNLAINATDGTKDTFNLNNNFSLGSGLQVTAGTLATTGATTLSATGLITVNGGTWTPSGLGITASGGFTCSSGTFTGSSGTMAVTGALTISGCSFTAITGTTTVTGNFAHSSGSFTHNSGTISLTGTSQQISGDTTFNNLSKTVSATDTLTFAATSTQIIAGTLTLQGASNNLLWLRSSSNNTQWNINPQGSISIAYLDVKDSDNINASYIAATGTNSTDSGNNTNWQFDLPSAPSPGTLGPTSFVNGSYNTNNQPNLTFTLANTDTNATVKYEIQIATVANFASTVVDYTSALAAPSATSFTVGQAAGSGVYTQGSSGQTLADNSSYYWRVKEIDNVGAASSYTPANSGGVAFGIDTTAPSIPGTPTTTNPNPNNKPTWTWTVSSDATSGLASPAYSVQWCGNSSFTGCSSTVDTASSTTYTHVVTLADGTWYFRVKATDIAGNVSAYSSNGSVVIDTTAPTIPGTPSTTTPTGSNTPTWSFTASTDSGSGLATPAYTVQWSQDSGFGSGITSSTSNTNSFTHGSPLADGTWYFRVKATDVAGNVSAYSSNGSVLIDTSPPTTPGTPTTTTPTNITKPAWSWTASTDSTVGLATPAYSVQWCSNSSFIACSSNVDTTITTSYTHSVSLANGTWYFRVKATNTLGTQSPFSSNGSVLVDTTSPTTLGTPSTTNPTSVNTPTWSWTASTDSGSGLATPAYTVEWSQDNTFLTGVTTSTANTNSFTHSLALADGTWYFKVQASDVVGNHSAFSSFGTVRIDTTAPTGSIAINASAGYTNTTSVTLTLSANDSQDATVDLVMEVSNDAGFSGASYQAFASSLPWTINSGEGSQIVYVRYKNTTGIVSSNYSASIVLDTVSPSVPGTPTTTNPNSSNKPAWSWTASTDATSGLATPAYTVQWSQDNTFTSGVSSSTSNTNSFTHSSTLADGTWYFRVKATDNATNVSSYSSYGTVLVDTTAPSVPGTPSTATPTGNTTPTWSWTASTDSGSGLAATPYSVIWCQDNTFPGSCNSNTGTAATNSFTQPSAISGTWYFKVKALDLAGNQSAYSSAGTVVVNSSAPTGSISINGGASYVNSTAVTVTLSATDTNYTTDQLTMEISNSSDFSGASYQAFASSLPWTVNSGEGGKTVYVRFQNPGGGTASYSASVTLDATSPTTPGTPSSTAVSNNGLPTWTWNDGTDITSGVSSYNLQWSQDSGFTTGVSATNIPANSFGVNTSGVYSYNNYNNGTNSSSNITKFTNTTALTKGVWYFRVQAVDNAANVSSWSGNNMVSVGEAPIGTITINDGSLYTNKSQVNLTISGTDNVDTPPNLQMKISNLKDLSDANYQTYATTLPFTLTTGDGVKIVYLQLKDAVGNESSIFSTTVILDTVLPNGQTFSLISPASPSETSSDGYTDNHYPTFVFTQATDLIGIGNYQIAITNAQGTGDFTIANIPPNPDPGTTKHQTQFYTAVYNGNTISVYAKSNPLWCQTCSNGALNEGTITWTVTAYDKALNTLSLSRSLIARFTPPVISNVKSTITSSNTDTISWNTDEKTIGTIHWGTTNTYKHTVTDNTYATSHSVKIENLVSVTPQKKNNFGFLSFISPAYAATDFHYQIVSTDQAGNITTSSDQTFAVSPSISTTVATTTSQTISSVGNTISSFVSTIKIPSLPVTVDSQVKKISALPLTKVGFPAISIGSGLISTSAFGDLLGIMPLIEDFFLILLRLFFSILEFFGLKKKAKSWGVVFDSVTKQPIDPALVKLLLRTSKEQTGQTIYQYKEMEMRVTNFEGQYGFLVEKGVYKLTVEKTDYTFPSLVLQGKTEDEGRENLYFGEDIVVSDPQLVKVNIPLDQVRYNYNQAAKPIQYRKPSFIKQLFAKTPFSITLFLIGAFISGASYFFNPSLLNACILGLYAVVMLVTKVTHQEKQWGIVSDKQTNIVLPGMHVKDVRLIRNEKTGEKTEIIGGVATTDKYGRYYFILDEGEHYLTVEKVLATGETQSLKKVGPYHISHNRSFVFPDIAV